MEYLEDSVCVSLKNSINQSGDAVILTDLQDRVISFNPVAEELFKVDSQEVEGLGVHCFLPDYSLLSGEPVCKPVSQSEPVQPLLLLRGVVSDGDKLSLQTSVMPLSVGQFQAKMLILRDVTEHEKVQEDLHYLSNYDALTGLANRALYQERLEHAFIRSERRENLAVLYLDLDGFNSINDVLNEKVGNELLKETAQRIRHTVRKEDTVARLASDEFAIILEDVKDINNIAAIAENLLQSFTAPFNVAENDLFVTVSIGIAISSLETREPEVLTKQAHSAMRHVKKNGKNNYQYYSSDLNQAVRLKISMSNDLFKALDQEELSLVYQPQVDLVTGRITGSESLLRWNHPRYGEVSPATFIPIVEESGLIDSIGGWVLKQACIQQDEWIRANPSMKLSSISVNISAKQFRRGNLIRLVQQTLDETGVKPEKLMLEITESTLMSDLIETRKTLWGLKELGVEIALDDFGTGYSSLSYLKQFPIDQIKIDRSFVRDLLVDPDDAAIASAIISLAHSLQLSVVAEGVDCPEKLNFLKNRGCDTCQGFYIGKPLPADQSSWAANSLRWAS